MFIIFLSIYYCVTTTLTYIMSVILQLFLSIIYHIKFNSIKKKHKSLPSNNQRCVSFWITIFFVEKKEVRQCMYWSHLLDYILFLQVGSTMYVSPREESSFTIDTTFFIFKLLFMLTFYVIFDHSSYLKY
jgi:hypothetical protein